MEENHDVNNARFSIDKNPEENPFILTKRPGGCRKSIARKDSNAWKDFVMGTARLTYSYIRRDRHTEGHTHGATYAWGDMHTKETYARRGYTHGGDIHTKGHTYGGTYTWRDIHGGHTHMGTST